MGAAGTVGAVRRHRLALFIAALCAVAVATTLLPGQTTRGALAQSGVLAVVGLAAAGLARDATLAWPQAHWHAGGGRGRSGASGRRSLRSWQWAAYLMLVALAAGVASAAAGAVTGNGNEGGASGATWALAVAIVATCLLTGIFEEGVFRVAAVEAFEDSFGRAGARGTMRAALASALVFGLAHVTTGDVQAAAGLGATAWAQVVLKPLQTALFGFGMAAAYARTRSLWPLAALHAAFDLLCLGPTMLANGSLQLVYVTGNAANLAILAATTALLVPFAIAAARGLGASGARRAIS